MKNRIILSLVILGGLFASCNNSDYQLIVKNPMDQVRLDEPVTIRRDKLTALADDISGDEVILVMDGNHTPVASGTRTQVTLARKLG